MWNHEIEQSILGLVPSIDKNQLQQLQEYTRLLLTWNKTYNLISPNTEKDIFTKHLLDCIAVYPYIKENKILDVGTGAGLPGIILAILYKDKYFTLIDSNGKKTRFIKQAAFELKIKNVSVLQTRVESYQSEEKFEAIISRAFADLSLMVQVTKHLLAPSGRFLAMKGRYVEEELEPLQKAYKITVQSLNVPLLLGQRHLIILEGI